MNYWIFIIGVLYIFSPIDLLPERVAGPFGYIDDAIVIGALYWYYVYRPAKLKERPRVAGNSEEEELEDEESEEIPGAAPEMDPYAILGVAKGASAEKIKHAYRELANKYHPDKVSHLGEEFKKLADKKFKEIQWAYEELTRG